jgi:hypothetical protein
MTAILAAMALVAASNEKRRRNGDRIPRKENSL